MKVKKLYPGGKPRALTLSYDDGIEQDRRFVEILNRYKLKCTFNLNSALNVVRDEWVSDHEVIVRRMPPEELPGLYAGHEAAMHMAHHPHPTELTDEELTRETVNDRDFHTKLFGYPVRGMAYPFGDYNDHVIAVLGALGVVYARTVVSTYGFGLPEEWLAWHPTCHHIESEMEPLWTSFLACDDELALYYLWGHSYEFDTRQEWDRIEKFCETAGGHKDVYYATNMEIYDYIGAVRQLQIGESSLYNPSELPVWVEVDGTVRRIEASETLACRD